MTEIIISVVVGLAVGIGGTAAVMHKPEPIPTKPHEGTEQAIKQLTALDLTEPVCKPKYIEKHGNLLCRELTCLQFTRGLDSQTSGAQCESISNIANKLEIREACKNIEEQEERRACIDIFWKRN